MLTKAQLAQRQAEMRKRSRLPMRDIPPTARKTWRPTRKWKKTLVKKHTV